MAKIEDYPVYTSPLNVNSLLDTSEYDGVSAFTSKKIKASDLFDEMGMLRTGTANNTIYFNGSGLQTQSNALTNNGTDITIANILNVQNAKINARQIDFDSSTNTTVISDVNGGVQFDLNAYGGTELDITTDNFAYNKAFFTMSDGFVDWGFWNGYNCPIGFLANTTDGGQIYASSDSQRLMLALGRTTPLYVAKNAQTTPNFAHYTMGLGSQNATLNGNLYNNSIALGGNGQTINKSGWAFAQNLEVQGGAFAHTSAAGAFGIFGATPIVQPTTGIAASVFVANTSGIADDTATFDGYTIGKVVKALRNLGILA